MPIRVYYKPDLRLVVIAHLGEIPDDEFFSFYQGYVRDQRIDLSFNVLVDLRASRGKPRGSQAIQKLAAEISKRLVPNPKDRKLAFIADKDVLFGLSRMYAAFRDLDDENVAFFKQAADALDWLGLPAIFLEELYRMPADW